MFIRVYEAISYTVAAVLLLLMTFLTLADVLGRNLLESPIAGATELTEYALVGLTFLIYPLVALRQKHIVVDLFDHFLGKKALLMEQFVAGLVGAVVFGFLAWRFWLQGDRLIEYGDVSPYLRIPVAPAYYFMSILSGVTTVMFVLAAFGVGKAKEESCIPQARAE